MPGFVVPTGARHTVNTQLLKFLVGRGTHGFQPNSDQLRYTLDHRQRKKGSRHFPSTATGLGAGAAKWLTVDNMVAVGAWFALPYSQLHELRTLTIAQVSMSDIVIGGQYPELYGTIGLPIVIPSVVGAHDNVVDDIALPVFTFTTTSLTQVLVFRADGCRIEWTCLGQRGNAMQYFMAWRLTDKQLLLAQVELDTAASDKALSLIQKGKTDVGACLEDVVRPNTVWGRARKLFSWTGKQQAPFAGAHSPPKQLFGDVISTRTEEGRLQHASVLLFDKTAGVDMVIKMVTILRVSRDAGGRLYIKLVPNWLQRLGALYVLMRRMRGFELRLGPLGSVGFSVELAQVPMQTNYGRTESHTNTESFGSQFSSLGGLQAEVSKCIMQLYDYSANASLFQCVARAVSTHIAQRIDNAGWINPIGEYTCFLALSRQSAYEPGNRRFLVDRAGLIRGNMILECENCCEIEHVGGKVQRYLMLPSRNADMYHCELAPSVKRTNSGCGSYGAGCECGVPMRPLTGPERGIYVGYDHVLAHDNAAEWFLSMLPDAAGGTNYSMMPQGGPWLGTRGMLARKDDLAPQYYYIGDRRYTGKQALTQINSNLNDIIKLLKALELLDRANVVLEPNYAKYSTGSLGFSCNFSGLAQESGVPAEYQGGLHDICWLMVILGLLAGSTGCIDRVRLYTVEFSVNYTEMWAVLRVLSKSGLIDAVGDYGLGSGCGTNEESFAAVAASVARLEELNLESGDDEAAVIGLDIGRRATTIRVKVANGMAIAQCTNQDCMHGGRDPLSSRKKRTSCGYGSFSPEDSDVDYNHAITAVTQMMAQNHERMPSTSGVGSGDRWYQDH